MTTVTKAQRSPARDAGVGWCANPFVEWLLTEAWNVTSTPHLLEGLARRLVAGGIPLQRMQAHIRTLHPQVVAAAYTWRRDTDGIEEFFPPHDILQSPTILDSSLAPIFEGAGGIRRRLDIPDARLDYPVLKDLHAEGATDYVAMPLLFSDGQINAITFVSDKPGGFATADLERLYEMLPVLARLLEAQATRRTARTLLETYLGRHTGERVLDGLIKRGDGETIHAVIWFCDLRDSTSLADSMSREDFLEILNDFFDCMAGAVLDHGGEVLRFIGDAALAIFPVAPDAKRSAREGGCSAPEACSKALAAARDARARIAALNETRAQRGVAALRYGLALHMGDLLYGNIGVPERLEFTVIGAAANEAARLEGLCKTLDRPMLLSAEFVHCLPRGWVSMGRHALRGVGAPMEVFAPPPDDG